MPDKFIIITSINPPTAALKKFNEMEDWQVVVVADRKTPTDWQFGNIKVLTVEDQKALPLETPKFLPWNHYARKNLGYLYAMMQEASVIYETDDDNIPYDSWELDLLGAESLETRVRQSSSQFINAYRYFSEENVWPRGFPLSAIMGEQDKQSTNAVNLPAHRFPVLQGLADLEPDVDAIYRLTVGKTITFEQTDPLFIDEKTYCPFNSQNTFWRPEAFQYLFLPAYIPSRVTDIWRSYIVQRFLHLKEQGVLFFSPTVYQERNYHNLLHDFAEEVALYTKTESLITTLEKYSGSFAEVMTYLVSENFFPAEEELLFQAWLRDLQTLGIRLS